jgi:hypothetical protein
VERAVTDLHLARVVVAAAVVLLDRLLTALPLQTILLIALPAAALVRMVGAQVQLAEAARTQAVMARTVLAAVRRAAQARRAATDQMAAAVAAAKAGPQARHGYQAMVVPVLNLMHHMDLAAAVAVLADRRMQVPRLLADLAAHTAAAAVAAVHRQVEPG